MKWVPARIFVILILAALLSGCGSVKNVTNNPPANADIEGDWEIVATSTTNPGVVSVIDVTLTNNVGPGGSFSGAALTCSPKSSHSRV